MLESSTWLDFLTALMIGALVGIEREKRKREATDPRGVGLRTFMLLALFGALASFLGASHSSLSWLLPAALLAAVTLLAAGYWLDTRSSVDTPGMTTEMAALCVFLLGALCVVGERVLAAGLGVALAAVLAYKQPLHSLVVRLGWDDVFAGLRLLVATFIVLPLLPDRAIDPWQAINPYRLWWLVLLIAALSLIGYVGTRLLGEGRGAALTGLTGGLVSSTAVTLSFARQSRLGDQPPVAMMLACGVMLAWGVMFVRVLVAVLIVNRALWPALWPPVLAAGLACLVLAGGLYWRGQTARSVDATHAGVPLKNPFSLLSAISFGLVFALVLLIVKLVGQYLPGQGEYVVAALAGLTDVDAVTLSMAEYARSGDADIAVGAILIAIAANTLCKCGMLIALGGRNLRRIVTAATGVLLLVGGLVFAVQG